MPTDVIKSRKGRRVATATQAAATDRTRTQLGLSWMPLPTTRPGKQAPSAELLSREDFAKRAPWEMLLGDEPGIKRGEMPLGLGDVAGAGTLLKRVADMSPGIIKFLRRVTSGKTGEMLREQVPSLRLEGGTLSYKDEEIPQLVEAMRRLDAPVGLLGKRDFVRGPTVRSIENEAVIRERYSAAPGYAIRVGVAGSKPMIMFPDKGTRMPEVDPLHEPANAAYVRWLEQRNPAKLAQLIREQGEIAQTQPFRPGPLLPFEEGGPRPGMYPGEPRVPSRRAIQAKGRVTTEEAIQRGFIDDFISPAHADAAYRAGGGAEGLGGVARSEGYSSTEAMLRADPPAMLEELRRITLSALENGVALRVRGRGAIQREYDMILREQARRAGR